MTVIQSNKERLLGVHCPSCGAPAEYDILKQNYHCAYCSGEVTIGQSLAEKRGFRKMRQEKLKSEQKSYKLTEFQCGGCGSRIVFPEGEALSSCSFCGRALVRGNYLKNSEFPELVIPFRITLEEAKKEVLDWCKANSTKSEARLIQKNIDDLQGFYLPYELVRGPVETRVSRKDHAIGGMECEGFLEGNFINTSKQLNNLVLNAMEPYDLSELNEFDFSYLAGQRVKINDLEDKYLKYRIKDEVEYDYMPFFTKTFQSKSLYVFPKVDDLVRMPVLLPAYFINKEKIAMAVNGQTGKVSVKSNRVRYEMPWWLKLIFVILVTAAISFAVSWLILREVMGALYMTGMFMVVMALIFYTAFSDAFEGQGIFVLKEVIYSSRKKPLKRTDGILQEGEEIASNYQDPIFMAEIQKTRTPVLIEFNPPLRKLKNLLICIAVIFLPFFFALPFSGFHPEKIHLTGAGIWLIITVIVVPAIYIKVLNIDVYDQAVLYEYNPAGKKQKKLYRGTAEEQASDRKALLILAIIVVAFAAFNGWLTLVI